MVDQVQHPGVDWLTQLLNFQNVNTTVELLNVEDETGVSCWLVINAENLSDGQVEALIGPKGQVLDSIQYLANTTLNLGKSPEDQQAFTIELAGYRAQRLEELKVIADQAAAQARETGEEFEVRDLSSAERRQVHHFLSTYEGLETFSRGREPDRRLVVRISQ